MHIETQAELLKLTRLLECEENALDFLNGQDLGQLADGPTEAQGEDPPQPLLALRG